MVCEANLLTITLQRGSQNPLEYRLKGIELDVDVFKEHQQQLNKLANIY